MLLITLCLLHIRFLLASVCSFGKGGSAGELTTCLGGLDSIVSNDELGKLIGTIIEYVENSPYPLLYLGGPNGRTPFDILGELQALKDQAANWIPGNTVLQFYKKIQEIMIKLRDPHAMVVFPFLRYFWYALPYGFAPVPGTGNEKYFKLVANTFTEEYLKGSGVVDNTNSIITEIKYGGESKAAAEAFSEFANEISAEDDNPHGQFNEVLKRANRFNALLLISPEVKYGDSNGLLQVKKKDAAGGADVSLGIPWLGVVSEDAPDSFGAMNPLVTESTKGSPDLEGKRFLEVFRNIRKKSDISPVEKEVAKALKKLDREYGHNPDNKKYTSRDHSSRSLVNADINLDQIFEDSNKICYIYKDTDNKIGYIRHKSYMIEDEAEILAFVKEFANKYKELVNAGVENIIYDVRGNGGGLVYLVAKMLEFFFHNRLYPADPEFDALFSGFSQLDALANEVFAESPTDFPNYKINADGTKQYFDTIDPLPSLRTLSNKTGGSSIPFTKQFTQRSYMTTPPLDATMIEAYKGYSPFDPQHFYIVSDAVCSSGCGVMTRTAIEAKSARVLGYGKNPAVAAADLLDKYYPGDCPGTLLGTDQVEAVRQGVQSLELPPGVGISDLFPDFATVQDVLNLLPTAFEREGVQMGVTMHEFFSPNPLHREETLFFVKSRVAAVLPLQVSSEAETIGDLEAIAASIKDTYIDHSEVCFDGEVNKDDACAAPEEHQVWGKSCAAGTFTGSCAFAYCETGYYLAKSSPITCAKYQFVFPPDPPEPPEPCPEGQTRSDAGVCESGSSKVLAPVLLIVLLLAFLMQW